MPAYGRLFVFFLILRLKSSLFNQFQSKWTNQYFRRTFQTGSYCCKNWDWTYFTALWLLTAKEELTGRGISRPTGTTLLWRLARWMCLITARLRVTRSDYQVCVPRDFKCFCTLKSDLLYRCSGGSRVFSPPSRPANLPAPHSRRGRC